MESFGEIIRKLRQERKLPLRTVAAFLDIDLAILSKIERDQRNASRNIVIKLAEYYNTDKDRMMVAWLSDNLSHQLENDENALEALQVAETKVLYRTKKEPDRGIIIKTISDFLRKDGRISKAWIFGSFARGQGSTFNDIDLEVQYSDKASGTLFDYADIKFKLEELLNRKIDLVEEGFIKSFAEESMNRDKILIYG
jgi:predicted nucleotidyltransferase/plasmid maintenance system antidote protein VapI